MRLFLTSTGLNSEKLKKEFCKLLKKPKEELKVLIIGSKTDKKNMKFVTIQIKNLIALGIKKKNICLVSISKNVNFNDFLNTDIIYVLGGNTFYILNKLRKNKFEKFLNKWDEKDKIYLGLSAGSIIAGPSIKIAGWGSEKDNNNIKIKNLKGLNITDISVYPHYEDKLKKEIDAFKKIVDYPVKTLKNDEALIINNKVRNTK